MKKILKFLLLIFLSLFFYKYPNLEAKTLGELKTELEQRKNNLRSVESKASETKAKINKYKEEINSASENIRKCEEDIEESRKKIDELNAEIEAKKKEIEDLLRFLQISNGESGYLEYIFGAKDFTDFIYRTALVEELSEYNDNLIDEMYKMIEQNKKLQQELSEKIKKLEKDIASFQEKLKSLNLSMDDLDDEKKDLNSEIKLADEEIKYYEELGCKDNQDISSCSSIPYSGNLTRPLTAGYISSNYGYRYIWGSTSFHRGIDIATSEWTPVYASASGQVYVTLGKPSGKRCGGQMVYIKHNINGEKLTTVYMHLIQINVSAGDYVNINTIIGYSGGGAGTQSWESCSTGAHLHFGIFKGWTTSSSAATDPRNYVNFPAKGSRFYSRW